MKSQMHWEVEPLICLGLCVFAFYNEMGAHVQGPLQKVLSLHIGPFTDQSYILLRDIRYESWTSPKAEGCFGICWAIVAHLHFGSFSFKYRYPREIIKIKHRATTSRLSNSLKCAPDFHLEEKQAGMWDLREFYPSEPTSISERL